MLSTYRLGGTVACIPPLPTLFANNTRSISIFILNLLPKIILPLLTKFCTRAVMGDLRANISPVCVGFDRYTSRYQDVVR